MMRGMHNGLNAERNLVEVRDNLYGFAQTMLVEKLGVEPCEEAFPLLQAQVLNPGDLLGR